MGRIGLALALLIGWMSVAHADPASGNSIEATPDQLFVRTPATIVTNDKAGNVSEPVESDVPVERMKPYRCGLGVMIYLVGTFVVTTGLLFLLLIIGFVRKRAPKTVAGEFVSPILAENVARIVARGDAIKLAVATLTTTGLWTFGHPFMAIMSGPFVLVWLIELVMSRFAVGQFDADIPRLEKRENWIYINSTKLYAPNRAWAKASALPSASVLD